MNRLKRLLLGTAYVALGCKLLIPAGYMPAPLGSGAPFTLCPGEFPVGLLEGAARHGDHAGHGQHADHDGGATHGEHDEASIWEHCSVGALAATPALASAYLIGIPEAGPIAIAVAASSNAPSRRTLVFRARAPPRSLS